MNFLIVISAAKMARLVFAANPFWIRIQKRFMASVLTALAAKMAFTKVK